MSLLANVPTLSYISWKNMIITYKETTYQIENSHTNRMYIYWDLKNPYLLTTSNVKLEPRNDLFYIIFNNSGTYTVVPNDNIEIDFSENPSRSAITNRIVGLSNDTKDKFTAVQVDIDGIKFDVYDSEGKFSKFEQRVDRIDLEVKGVEKKYSDDPQLIKMREDFNEVLLSLQATLGLFSSDMNTYMEDNSLSNDEKNNIISYKTSLEQKRVELNNQLNVVVEYLNGIEDIDQARIIEVNASKDELNTAISNLFTNIDAVCSDNVFTNTEITAIVSYFGKTNLAINECKNTIDYVFLGIGGFLIEEVSNITLEQDNIKLEVKKVENHIDTEISKIELEQDNITLEVSKKVGKTEVISSINQTAESVKIKASKIQLEGCTSIGNMNGDYVKINDADYAIFNGDTIKGFLGLRTLDDGFDTVRLALSSTGLKRAQDNYFVITPYNGNGYNPQEYEYPYVDIAYRCQQFTTSEGYGDVSNIKIYGDGAMRLSPIKELQITTNFVSGKYVNEGEHTIATFGSSNSEYYNTHLAIQAVVDKTSSVGLKLGHETPNGSCFVRVNVDSGGNKAFRPLTDSKDIYLGSASYPWYRCYATLAESVTSDRRQKENIEYINETINPNAPRSMEYTLEDMYNFVKDDLSLAAYVMKIDNKKELKYGFIAQDIIDTKIGYNIVDQDNENDYIGYDTMNYTNVLAGALKQVINKIEKLENGIENLKNNGNE